VSTIQPTPPSAPAAPSTATTVARITSGAEVLANTRPGATVQVQVVSVTPGGQVTLSAPGGEIQVQTPSSSLPASPGQTQAQAQGQTTSHAQGQAAGRTPRQTTGQTPGQTQSQSPRDGNNQGTGRDPVTLKPGDVYTLRTGPRGSETISLSLQRAAPSPPPPATPPPTTQATGAPAPRAEGSVPTRLVPGAVTTATIIPRPSETAAPPPPTQQSVPTPATPPSNAARAYQPPQLTTPTQPAQQPPPTSTGATAAPLVDGADTASGRAGAPPTTAAGLAAIARAGTGALLRTALQAARAITDGVVRQAPAATDQSSINPNREQTTARPTAAPVPTAGGAARVPLPSSQGPPPSAPASVPLSTPTSGGSTSAANPPARAPVPAPTPPAQANTAPPPGSTATATPGAATTPAAGAAQSPGPARLPGAAQAPGTPPSAGAHPGPVPASAPAGGGVTSNASSPAPTATTQAPTTPATAGTPAAAGVVGVAGSPPAGLIAQFAQIQRVDIRILAVHQPGATTTNAANSAVATPGTVVSGTVIGLSRSGQSILNTPRGLMTLVGQAEFPPGSRVEVEILPLSSRAGTARGAAAPTPAPLAHLAQHWETLDQAIRLLEVANPSAANQITQNHVARPGPQLTAAIALFITAVRGGDLRAWLGEENNRALELARAGLGSTLREEFGTMQRASEPNDGGWRGFFIPFLDDGQLNQIRLFLHQERDARDNEERQAAERTRFVVDLSLSQLGDLQIDGAVQPEVVDLLIRTREALPRVMRQEIRDIFTTTLARTGIEGQLAFRTQKTFPTLPIEELHGYQDGPTSDLHI
jgi:hypothetical protein